MARSTEIPAPQPRKPQAGARLVCNACQGGRVEPVVTSAVFFWTAIPTIVENVPALLCRDCGERHLAVEVADRLDGIRRMADRAVTLRHVSVPVVDYAASDPG